MKDFLIFVDLDNTLIDSVRRYEDEQLIASSYGISTEDYVAAVDELYRRKMKYSFPTVYSILCEKFLELPGELLAELQALLSKNYFFPDAKPFLKEFGRNRIVLVTSGDEDFQQAKIRTHNIGEFVRGVYISGNKPEVVMNYTMPWEKAFFIDDAPKEIDLMKRRCPMVTAIQVRQPPPWEKQKTSQFKDVHLPTLADVSRYIQNRLAE